MCKKRMGGFSRGVVFSIENRGFRGKIGGFGGFMIKNRGFGGKMVVFLKNGVFMGFWSINRGKVEKSREFDHFLKIGENREK